MNHASRLSLIGFLTASLFIAGCGGDSASDPDDTLDAGATGDAVEDSATTEPDADEAADATTEPDAVDAVAPDDDSGDDAEDGDTEPDVLEPCEEGRRRVGEFCRDDLDRVCLRDEDCRPTEYCEPPTGNDQLGTCIYTPRERVTCPGAPGCEQSDGPLRVGFGKADVSLYHWELGRPRYTERPDAFGNPTRFVGDVTDPSTFCDCGLDGICPPTEAFEECVSAGEYLGPDEDGTEGDGYMQGAWIAGFNNSRLAQQCPEEWLADDCVEPFCCTHPGAHDPIWVRVVVFEQGDLRYALASVDTVGYFYEDQLLNLAAFDPAWGIDWLTVTATHNHEAADTMGQWGPGAFGSPLPNDTGTLPQYMALIERGLLRAVADAVEQLAPVDVYATQVNTGADGFAIRDSRNPFVFDDLVTAVRFVREGEQPDAPDATLGTILNWHSHPEAAGGNNVYMTSDFPHYFREYLENGLTEPAVDVVTGREYPARPGVGGIALYISGSVGGLLTPLGVPATGRDGTVYNENGFGKVHALGERLADTTLEAMRLPCEGTEMFGCTRQIDDETLSFAHEELMLELENINFQIAGISLGILNRLIFNWRRSDGVGFQADKLPEVRTLVSQLRLGPIAFQSFPGEAFPEVVTGWRLDRVRRNPILGDPQDLNCAEDRRTRLMPDVEPRFGCLIRENNPNPPNLDAYPDIEPLASEIPADYLVVVGLGNDALGYLVPPYDFQVDPVVGVLAEVDGDHYEETNALGDVWSTVLQSIRGVNDALNALP